uniref:Uncharacterized protein n=1 Tax=Vespula pensylvanica TaxID=30213 RepID=A0A834UEK7_VESPE|nr:hypothetical protein H0235_002717 [Vespula pensylvanica]
MESGVNEKKEEAMVALMHAPTLTCTEPYFISEGLYAPLEDLDNTREITLHTMTIGLFIEDPGKKLEAVEGRCQKKRQLCYHKIVVPRLSQVYSSNSHGGGDCDDRTIPRHGSEHKLFRRRSKSD